MCRSTAIVDVYKAALHWWSSLDFLKAPIALCVLASKIGISAKASQTSLRRSCKRAAAYDLLAHVRIEGDAITNTEY